MKLSVLIPTLEAEVYLETLISSLKQQSQGIAEIIIIDSGSKDNTVLLASSLGCRVYNTSTFDHGKTRNELASYAQGEILIFMTQDVLPVDSNCMAKLVEPFKDEGVAATYARQMAKAPADPLEVFARQFNYPKEDRRQSKVDVANLGFKTFFFSNACSAISKQAFKALNGFPEYVIMNEDTSFAYKAVVAGYSIVYVSEARVWHTHNYPLSKTFQRYFDIGVSHHQNADWLALAKPSGEGLKYFRSLIQYLIAERQVLSLPRAFLEVAIKYLAYQLGKRYRYLPIALSSRLSMHKYYWRQKH